MNPAGYAKPEELAGDRAIKERALISYRLPLGDTVNKNLGC